MGSSSSIAQKHGGPLLKSISLEKIFLCSSSCSWKSLCRAGLAWTHGDPPTLPPKYWGSQYVSPHLAHLASWVDTLFFLHKAFSTPPYLHHLFSACSLKVISTELLALSWAT